MIEGKSLDELDELKKEIEATLSADRSMALELQYWSNVLKRIDEQIAKTKIETIYEKYFNENKTMILQGIQKAQAKKRAALHSHPDGGGGGPSKDYQTPFTALKIDNTKKGMTSSNTANEGPYLIPGSDDIGGRYSMKEELKYNDGTLSPFLIPYDEAGYLQSLATNDEQIMQDQEQLMKEYITKQLKKLLAKQQSEAEQLRAPESNNLTAVEKVKKTALNTLVRFDIDAMGFDNSSLNMYEELKRKGVGQDEEEFTDILFSADLNPKLPI